MMWKMHRMEKRRAGGWARKKCVLKVTTESGTDFEGTWTLSRWKSISVNLSPSLARTCSPHIRRSHGVLTRKVSTAIWRPPSGPSLELAHVGGNDGIARQRALIGDSLDDKEWSDDLFNPSPALGNPV